MKPDLKNYNPCKDGLTYYNSHTTFAEAWEQCPRGDWMLWVAQELGVEHKLLIKTTALCINTVRHLMKDERSIRAIDVALAYADGRVTKEELRAVARITYPAGAGGASYAAYTAYTNADTVDESLNAEKANQLLTADICREHLTEAIFEILNIKKRNYE